MPNVTRETWPVPVTKETWPDPGNLPSEVFDINKDIQEEEDSHARSLYADFRSLSLEEVLGGELRKVSNEVQEATLENVESKRQDPGPAGHIVDRF